MTFLNVVGHEEFLEIDENAIIYRKKFSKKFKDRKARVIERRKLKNTNDVVYYSVENKTMRCNVIRAIEETLKGKTFKADERLNLVIIPEIRERFNLNTKNFISMVKWEKEFYCKILNIKSKELENEIEIIRRKK